MIESLLLVCSLCVDSFVASMAYAASKIHISKLSATIINLVCTITLAFSLALGSIVKQFLPSQIPEILGFCLLIILGVYRLFEFLFKSYIAKRFLLNEPLKFKLFDFNFVLKVYSNEITADFDKSKSLNPKEAFYLATALSLDSIAVGFSSSLCSINYFQVLIFCIVIGYAAIFMGNLVGKNFAKKFHVELSWLSGLLLIILAFVRIF